MKSVNREVRLNLRDSLYDQTLHDSRFHEIDDAIWVPLLDIMGPARRCIIGEIERSV